MKSKLNRSHIGKEYMTTISGSHFESQVFDGLYVNGSHAQEYGAVLNDKTDDYRIYYSFDGVGIDILEHNIHLVLTTTNNGTPFHEWLWLFAAQKAVQQIFGEEAIHADKRVIVARKLLQQNREPFEAFQRHIEKMISGE
ncbi:MAG: hypothetical protein Q9M13_06475 [Mariprofundales bacterium]|nr:hypothetical protein [Mariprofundales bacterium]